MTFKALIVEKNEDGKPNASVQSIGEDRLPTGENGAVHIDVAHSTLNYKDGLCIGSGGGLVRNYPHIPGIDMAGSVTHSDDPRYKAGDKVVLTGWRYGEAYWGGYSQKTRANADWLVRLPDGLDTRQAMAIGTAGLAAMLAIMAMEDHGLKPDNGPVLVTGAAGGVGSIATAVLAKMGYQVTAVTGRAESADYLRGLGATDIIARTDLNETVKRPLESEVWAGCVDAVGGDMLARVLGQMKYGACVSAVGLAGGAGLPATVIPFLLRGIVLAGIDSVMCPYERRVIAWQRLGRDLPLAKLESMIETVGLADLPDLGRAILKGAVKGRIVVDVNS